MKARTEEVKQVLYCVYSLKPHLFIQSSDAMNFRGGRGRKGRWWGDVSEKKETCFMLLPDT